MTTGPNAHFAMPQNLASAAAGGDERKAWIERLPEIIGDIASRWQLELGAPFQPGGETAWVAPARDRTGTDLALKVGWRHHEATHEAAGLAAWDGDGIVRLIDERIVDDETVALLVERCVPGHPLSTEPELQQDVVIAGLLRRLWRPPAADAPFRPLSEMCALWADGFERSDRHRVSGLDPGLISEGMALLRSLPSSAKDHLLLATDLHAGNVLSAEREPWLAIDPKPHRGDPCYDATQHMLNCEGRLRSDPIDFASRMAALLDIDSDRLLLWLFARCVEQSSSGPAAADVAKQLAP